MIPISNISIDMEQPEGSPDLKIRTSWKSQDGSICSINGGLPADVAADVLPDLFHDIFLEILAIEAEKASGGVSDVRK